MLLTTEHPPRHVRHPFGCPQRMDHQPHLIQQLPLLRLGQVGSFYVLQHCLERPDELLAWIGHLPDSYEPLIRESARHNVYEGLAGYLSTLMHQGQVALVVELLQTKLYLGFAHPFDGRSPPFDLTSIHNSGEVILCVPLIDPFVHEAQQCYLSFPGRIPRLSHRTTASTTASVHRPERL